MQSTLTVPINYLLWRFRARERVYQFAAFAFITTQKKGETHYLLQWNEKWQCFNFIGGKLDNCKGDNDDLACTMKREIQEEIGIGYLDGVIAIEQEVRKLRTKDGMPISKTVYRILKAMGEIN